MQTCDKRKKKWTTAHEGRRNVFFVMWQRACMAFLKCMCAKTHTHTLPPAKMFGSCFWHKMDILQHARAQSKLTLEKTNQRHTQARKRWSKSMLQRPNLNIYLIYLHECDFLSKCTGTYTHQVKRIVYKLHYKITQHFHLENPALTPFTAHKPRHKLWLLPVLILPLRADLILADHWCSI